jgi:hypothetical protein
MGAARTIASARRWLRPLALGAPPLLVLALAGTACEPKPYAWAGEVVVTQYEADDPDVVIQVTTVYTLPRNKPFTVGQSVYLLENIAPPSPCVPPETHLVSIKKVGHQDGGAEGSGTDPGTGAGTITMSLAATEPTPIETTVRTNCGEASDQSGERWGAVQFSFPNPGPGEETAGGVELRSGDIDGPVNVTWELSSYHPK